MEKGNNSPEEQKKVEQESSHDGSLNTTAESIDPMDSRLMRETEVKEGSENIGSAENSLHINQGENLPENVL